MIKHQFEAQKLRILLEDFYCKKASGTLRVNVEIKPELSQKFYILVFNDGAITYAGLEILSSKEFAKKLWRKINPGLSNTAIDAMIKKVTNPSSVQELIERLIKIRVLKWEPIISFIQAEIVQILEKILPIAGDLEFNPGLEFDLQFNENNQKFCWPMLMEKLSLRQQEWTKLAPIIPSVNAVPFLPINVLEKIPEPAVQQHLQKWVDGQRTLGDIAEKIDKDSLIIAKLYFNWVQKSWVTFDKNLFIANNKLPTILSVDDSPIVQATIKRILGNRCNLLLASNAVDALNILKKDQVSLLLLDLTMPDIDGLQVCKTLRSIPKFRDLSIVIVTARDGLIDKVKGQMAGTNRYLTKPFDSEKLLSVVQEFVTFGNT